MNFGWRRRNGLLGPSIHIGRYLVLEIQRKAAILLQDWFLFFLVSVFYGLTWLEDLNVGQFQVAKAAWFCRSFQSVIIWALKFVCTYKFCSYWANIVSKKRRVSHAAKRKTNERAKGKFLEGGSRGQNRCDMCLLTFPPSLWPDKDAAAPPPPLPLPQLGQFSEGTEDLHDGLWMEVKSRKTYIGQWWWSLLAFTFFW